MNWREFFCFDEFEIVCSLLDHLWNELVICVKDILEIFESIRNWFDGLLLLETFNCFWMEIFCLDSANWSDETEDFV